MNEAPKIVGDGPIVMVDDSESDAYLARKCYEKSSVTNEFVWLQGGEEFIEFLEGVKAGRSPMPALVLLDINMPNIDGFELLEKIRSVPEFKEVPIITMLTNSDDPRDIDKSMNLGANGYYTKPSDIKDFVSFFNSLLD